MSFLITSEYAFGQFQTGGVDKEGSWYVSEGLKHGDFYSYSICQIDYKECSEIQMDIWMENNLAHVVVYDENRIIKGDMTIGTTAVSRSGEGFATYSDIFRKSATWLSPYANINEPKLFSAASWGKIGNIGGEQIIPTSVENVSYEGGYFESIKLTWKAGSYTSSVWVADEFPFPVKARVFTHVSEGIPPPEYTIDLIKFKENVTTDPFSNIKANYFPPDDLSQLIYLSEDRTTISLDSTLTIVNEDTRTHSFLSGKENYGDHNNPITPDGKISTGSIPPGDSTSIVFDEERLLILYDPDFPWLKITIFVFDSDGKQNPIIYIRSDSDDTSNRSPPSPIPTNAEVSFLTTDKDFYEKNELIVFSGFIDGLDNYQSTKVNLIINDPSGKILEPKGTFSDTSSEDSFEFRLHTSLFSMDGSYSAIAFVQSEELGSSTTFGFYADGVIPEPEPEPESPREKIPSWVKSNAKWWSQGNIDDDTFVGGIQHLMKERIVDIPDLPPQASEKARPNFVDPEKDPQSYVDRYENEEKYRDWFDSNYPDYTIEEAVGIPAPIPGWIKNTAGWWSDGLITEDEFIKGIEYLVENRILNVN